MIQAVVLISSMVLGAMIAQYGIKFGVCVIGAFIIYQMIRAIK